MLRVGRFLAPFFVATAAAAGVLLAGPARAQTARQAETMFALPVPGGLRAASAALRERAPAERSQFLVELIRRSQKPAAGKDAPLDAQVLALLDHFERATVAHGPALAYKSAFVDARQPAGNPLAADTVPLPLPIAIWTEIVFAGKATPTTLASEILRSRSASRFYCALLSLDDETRRWLAGEPALIAELSTRYAAPFLIAASGLRVNANGVRLPGGSAAEPLWQALAAGRSPKQPADFVRALLLANEGRLAYFFSAMAQLTATEAAFALNLDAADPAARVDAGRRLFAVYERLSAGWRVEDRPFSRPSLDPALLVAELTTDENGRPRLPGTRAFWAAAFGTDAASSRTSPGVVSVGETMDFVTLSEQIFKGGYVVHRRPYQQVLFASRMLPRITAENAADALTAVRAAGVFPALVSGLERAGVSDVAAYAAAARRAEQLSTLGAEERTTRALAQYQGLLVLVLRGLARGSFAPSQGTSLVISLSAVAPNERGEYEGRLVAWLGRLAGADPKAPAAGSNGTDPHHPRVDVFASAIDDFDRHVLDIAAGASNDRRAVIDWEGTRYRVDLAAAELSRLALLLGEHARPYLSSARALATAADDIAAANANAEALKPLRERIERVAQASEWEPDVASKLDRSVRTLGGRNAPDAAARTVLAGSLRTLADDLLGRGLLEIAYAAALGHPDRTPISAGDAARRHRFGFGMPGADRSSPWLPPVAGSDRDHDWHVRGSVLGLDVRLADLSLVSISTRPPLTRPTLNDGDRRVFIDTVALMGSVERTDAERDAIAAAIRAGRERLAALRTPEDAASLADAIQLGPLRRTLFLWTVAHDSAGLARALSPSELLRAGLHGKPVAAFAKWGVSSEPRSGCLCLSLFDRPWENLSGRWDSGIFATSFPDLNLRIAELLAELKMPAVLIGPVLGPATHDFLTSVTSRDQDDRRALVEFVEGLKVDRVEQYLALLTTDGPLVPLGDSIPPAAMEIAATGETGSRVLRGGRQ